MIPQLDPASTATCVQTARFGEEWLDASGKGIGNALVTSSFELQARGLELWYVDLLDDVEYD